MEKKKRRRWIAGFLAVIMTITGVGIPLPFPSEASDIWPQKSTAPFYCLDGGKGWKKVDRYDMYKFETMPSPLTETQAKRLFWAYPDNWSALKDAAKKFDPGLYADKLLSEHKFCIQCPRSVGKRQYLEWHCRIF